MKPSFPPGSFGRVAPIAIACSLLFAACSGSDSAEVTDEAPVTTLSDEDLSDGLFEDSVAATIPPAVVSCSTAAMELPSDWPFEVASDVIVSQAIQTEERFVLLGATTDSEQVLIDTLDRSFPDFEPGEPTGGMNDMAVAFTSSEGGAVIDMVDDDSDGCWTVRIVADFAGGSESIDEDLALPPVVDDRDDGVIDTGDGGGDAVTDDGTGDDGDGDGDTSTTEATVDTVPPDTIDPIVEAAAVGRGEIITARGTFPVAYTACSTAPLVVDGVTTAGRFEIRADGDRVEVQLTYDDDGAVISDDDADVLGLTADGGSIVADGENPEGPETLFITFMCDSSA